jgi:hypothetical protein
MVSTTASIAYCRVYAEKTSFNTLYLQDDQHEEWKSIDHKKNEVDQEIHW